MSKVLLLNDTRLAGHHGSATVVDVLFKEFVQRGIHVESHLLQPIEPQKLKEQGFAAVVINGEGSIHSGQKSSHELSRFAWEASERGVPVFLINTLFDEDSPEVVGRMRCLAAIYSRESRSVARLAGYGIAARMCPDLTYSAAVGDIPAWRPGKRVVVLDTTVASKNERLHRFCREHGLAFLPLRTTPPLLDASNIHNLIRTAKFSARRYAGKLFPHSYQLNRYSDAIDGVGAFLKRLADHTRIVVAGRFHGVCFCIKLGVPFLAVASNTPKIEGMLEDAGLEHRLADIDRLSLDLVTEKAAWSADDEGRVYVANAQASIREMFDDIAGRIGDISLNSQT